MLTRDDTTLGRWRALLLRLNQVEARAWSERDLIRRFVAARTTAHVRAQLVLTPAAAPAERPPLPEAAPPCPVCVGPLRRDREVLVACTACLAVAHRACLRGAPCVTPACLRERATG